MRVKAFWCPITLVLIVLAMGVGIIISMKRSPGTVYVSPPHSFQTKVGLVPDAGSAVRIAEAILTPIYGEDTIISERPFHASLKGDVWVVTGSLKKGWVGGVATAEISKKDARVLRISHGE